jgi:hypothetical protein
VQIIHTRRGFFLVKGVVAAVLIALSACERTTTAVVDAVTRQRGITHA